MKNKLDEIGGNLNVWDSVDDFCSDIMTYTIAGFRDRAVLKALSRELSKKEALEFSAGCEDRTIMIEGGKRKIKAEVKERC